MNWRATFTPNEPPTRRAFWIIVACWFGIWMAVWASTRAAIFPSPVDVVGAVPSMWTDYDLAGALITSLTTAAEALALSTAVGLPLAYLSVVPAFWPVAEAAALLRFLSPAVFFLLLAFVAPSTQAVKVLMLAMGEAFFLVQSMLDVVRTVPQERLDDCRTLRMNEWQVLWYGIVRHTLPDALAAVIANGAMGFAMLTMVERIGGGGGIGTMMLNFEKHFGFAEVYALSGLLVVVGFVTMDWTLQQLGAWLFPWAERR